MLTEQTGNQPTDSFISGFRLSPNSAADHLEKGLGISFKQKPYLIEFDRKNRQVLRRKWGSQNDIFTVLRRHRGGYYREENTVLARSRVVGMVFLHEDMHAYINQTNPGLACIADLKKAISEAKAGSDTSAYDSEKDIVQISFQEGICHLATCITAHELPGIYDQDAVRFFMREYAYEAPNGYKDRIFEQLKSSTQSLRDALRSNRANERPAVAVINRNWKAIEKLLDFAGWHFCRGAIDELTSEPNGSMKMNNAIDQLINNPPYTIEQLKDGTLYAFRLAWDKRISENWD